MLASILEDQLPGVVQRRRYSGVLGHIPADPGDHVQHGLVRVVVRSCLGNYRGRGQQGARLVPGGVQQDRDECHCGTQRLGHRTACQTTSATSAASAP